MISWSRSEACHKRHRRRGWLQAFGAFALLAYSTSAFAASAIDGRAAFTKFGCWQCHGTLGQGGVAGPRLAPNPIPVEGLIAFVRSSNRQMPAYSEHIISDQDLTNIHAYLSEVPKPPDYTKIPQLLP